MLAMALSVTETDRARASDSRPVRPSRGAFWLMAGVLCLLFCASAAAAATLLAGTAVAGVGFGLAVLGANRILIALAAPAQRARLVAAIFIINFLGLSVPVVIAGVATARFGLHLTRAPPHRRPGQQHRPGHH